jgi:hypothetical protein
VVPKISAFAHVHGNHDYMRKPFAPLGCAIEAHVKPDDRRTWDARSDSGYSLGTSMEHHRCFRVYITKTRSTRISDTVHFKHQYITKPTFSPESHVHFIHIKSVWHALYAVDGHKDAAPTCMATVRAWLCVTSGN